jgi:hypothetical protein
VASIEPSRFSEGRAYVAFDGHRSDDDEPHVYVTEDFGNSWKSLRSNLPPSPLGGEGTRVRGSTGSTRVLREDVKNPDLLFLGTEFAVLVSLDRGASWDRLNNNLPTVAIHELAIHPTTGEMVAATHGRSLWVLDITALRQMTATVRKARAHLFEPAPTVRWRSEPPRGPTMGAGSRRFVGQNPPRGAQIYYSLTAKAEKVSLRVVDHTGGTVRDLSIKKEPGLHRTAWDLMRQPGVIAGLAQKMGIGKPAAPPGPAAPGLYRVILSVDGQEFAQNLRVEPDPVAPQQMIAPERDGDEEEEEMEERGEKEIERDAVIDD